MPLRLAKILLRLIALCNFPFIALGVVDMSGAVSAFPVARKNALLVQPVAPWIDKPFPHLDSIFYTLIMINLAFLILLAFSSFFVWRLTAKGRFMLNLVFGLELLYWVGLPVLNIVLSRWAGDSGALVRMTIIMISPLANSGISSQLDVAYPLIGLIVGNAAYWTLSRNSVLGVCPRFGI